MLHTQSIKYNASLDKRVFIFSPYILPLSRSNNTLPITAHIAGLVQFSYPTPCSFHGAFKSSPPKQYLVCTLKFPISTNSLFQGGLHTMYCISLGQVYFALLKSPLLVYPAFMSKPLVHLAPPLEIVPCWYCCVIHSPNPCSRYYASTLSIISISFEAFMLPSNNLACTSVCWKC